MQPYYPELSPYRTGLACRCPRCGQGRVLEGLLGLREACEVCQLNYGGADVGDGPAPFAIFLLGAVLLPLMFLFRALFDPPFWLLILVSAVLIVLGTIAMLRPMKSLMVALQYRKKREEFGIPQGDDDGQD